MLGRLDSKIEQMVALLMLLAVFAVHSRVVTAQESLLMQPEEIYSSDPVDLPSEIAESFAEPKSSAYPDGDFYEQLQAAGGQGGCDSCGVDGSCDGRWGCGGSPYRTGPGCGDNWRVGPRWRIVADGALIYREKTNLASLATAMGTTLAAAEQSENFDRGGGIRLLGTASWPQCKGYEMTLGYVGVDAWNANIVLPVLAIPPVVGPPANVALDQRRSLTYRSSLHALELNWQGLNSSNWKPYAGVRYFRFAETVEDRTNQYTAAPLAVGETATTTFSLLGNKVDNNLIGFQVGLRRDLWQVSRKVYIQGFANAGLYGNFINRSDYDETATTTTEVLDDDAATPDVDETAQSRSSFMVN